MTEEAMLRKINRGKLILATLYLAADMIALFNKNNIDSSITQQMLVILDDVFLHFLNINRLQTNIRLSY